MHEFMTAVKQNYGEKVVIQFEDFANHNAFDLLAKYGTTHLVFNDDIQVYSDLRCVYTHVSSSETVISYTGHSISCACGTYWRS